MDFSPNAKSSLGSTALQELASPIAADDGAVVDESALTVELNGGLAGTDDDDDDSDSEFFLEQLNLLRLHEVDERECGQPELRSAERPSTLVMNPFANPTREHFPPWNEALAVVKDGKTVSFEDEIEMISVLNGSMLDNSTPVKVIDPPIEIQRKWNKLLWAETIAGGHLQTPFVVRTSINQHLLQHQAKAGSPGEINIQSPTMVDLFAAASTSEINGEDEMSFSRFSSMTVSSGHSGCSESFTLTTPKENRKRDESTRWNTPLGARAGAIINSVESKLGRSIKKSTTRRQNWSR